MPISYLHGIETIESEIGGQPVTIVKSGVVALFGIAPIGDVNSLKLCLNATDDAQFGKALPGFNIPKTLEIIRAIAGNCPVLVVNTFNGEANTVPVSLESQTVTLGKLKLAYAPIGDPTIYLADGTTLASIVNNTDYTLDAFGNFQVISNAISDGTVYKFTYGRLDGSTVTNEQLIGGVDGDNNRTGISLFDLAFNTFGFNAKVFISPLYSSISAIVSAMATAAAKFKAIYLADAPFGTTIAGAISGRGVSGSINFNINDERALLLYPYLKTFDDYLQADDNYPYSAFMAGVIVKNDNDNGYWQSPSNQSISNATGIERVIEWNPAGGYDTEANELNAAGIITVGSGFGTGYKTWGNRNASYPTSTSVRNFINIRRTDDIVTESMALASVPQLDKSISQAYIDNMRETGNSLMRTLIQRGAILPGSKVVYNKDDNTSDQLAAGHITFERVYMVGPSAERITFKDVLDINLLNQFN